MLEPTRLAKWLRLSGRTVFEALPWVRVRRDEVRLPSGRVIDDYYVVDIPDYVMLYPVAPDGRVLMIRQFRYASDRIDLTFPTGCVEPGESAEDTARRELLEETGHEAGRIEPLGTFIVDGNKGCGRVCFFAALDVRKKAEPARDETEQIEMMFVAPEFVTAALEAGEITELPAAALAALASIRLVKAQGKP